MCENNSEPDLQISEKGAQVQSRMNLTMNDVKAKVMGIAYLQQRRKEERWSMYRTKGRKTQIKATIFFSLTFPSQAMDFSIYSVIDILQNQLESVQ